MPPIFNVADLYRYAGENADDIVGDQEKQETDWVKQLPTSKELQPERILDKKLLKKTRGQEYFQYLVKWKDQPLADATWVRDDILQKLGNSVEELMDRSP